MDADFVFWYIQQHYPQTLIEPEILGPGVAYHYTPHADAIMAAGKFLGTPLVPNLNPAQTLDRRPWVMPPPPAVHDPGIVFAYKRLQDAQDRGRGYAILRIKYTGAVEALNQKQVAALGEEPFQEQPPRILLIWNRNIEHFDHPPDVPCPAGGPDSPG